MHWRLVPPYAPRLLTSSLQQQQASMQHSLVLTCAHRLLTSCKIVLLQNRERSTPTCRSIPSTRVSRSPVRGFRIRSRSCRPSQETSQETSCWWSRSRLVSLFCMGRALQIQVRFRITPSTQLKLLEVYVYMYMKYIYIYRHVRVCVRVFVYVYGSIYIYIYIERDNTYMYIYIETERESKITSVLTNSFKLGRLCLRLS